MSPTLVTQQVIEALDLQALVQKWGDPPRRCSNLDSILRHASEYEELAFDEGRAATLSGLILYLEQLADDESDTRYREALTTAGENVTSAYIHFPLAGVMAQLPTD